MEWPKIGERRNDATGRKLIVAEVAPGDRQGREIRGFIAPPDGSVISGTPYSCDAQTYDAIWRRRVPPATFRA